MWESGARTPMLQTFIVLLHQVHIASVLTVLWLIHCLYLSWLNQCGLKWDMGFGMLYCVYLLLRIWDDTKKNVFLYLITKQNQFGEVEVCTWQWTVIVTERKGEETHRRGALLWCNLFECDLVVIYMLNIHNNAPI